MNKKLLWAEVEDEQIIVSSAVYQEDDGPMVITASMLGTVTINGKRYKFDDSAVMDLIYVEDVE